MHGSKFPIVYRFTSLAAFAALLLRGVRTPGVTIALHHQPRGSRCFAARAV